MPWTLMFSVFLPVIVGALAGYGYSRGVPHILPGSPVASHVHFHGAKQQAPAPPVITITNLGDKFRIDLAPVPGATIYYLYKNTTGVTPNIGGYYTGGSGNSFLDTGNNGQQTYYWVEAVQYVGGSNFVWSTGLSNGVSGTLNLAAPQNVRLVQSPSVDALSWDSVPYATDYYIYQATAPAGPYTFTGYHPASGPYSMVGPPSGTSYYYYIQSHNDNGLGDFSYVVGPGLARLKGGTVIWGKVRPTDGCDAGCGAPSVSGSASDPVDLSTGVETFSPAPDLTSYNPNAMPAVWKRTFDSSQASNGYSSPGMTNGWVHNYDVQLVRASGSSTWRPLNIVYANGSSETLTPKLNVSGNPTGNFVLPTGAPYNVVGIASATPGQWTSISLVWKDRTTWVFYFLDADHYTFGRIKNSLGKGININWSAARKVTSVTDITSGRTLISLSYRTDGLIDTVTDYYSRMVKYSYQTISGSGLGGTYLTAVSQVVASGTTNPPAYSTYGYIGVNGQAFLNSSSAPNPTGTGLSTATINYGSSGRVNSITDANGNQHVYTYANGTTLVQFKNSAGVVEASYNQFFDGQNRDIGVADAAGNRSILAYGDAKNPFSVTQATNPKGRATTFTYDTFGNLLTTTSPRGVVTTLSYDYSPWFMGRLVGAQEGSKVATTFTYNEPSGFIASVTGARPGGGALVSTTFTYDGLGNVLTVNTPGNNAVGVETTTYNYTADSSYTQAAMVGQPLTVSDPLGHVTHLRYDTQARTTTTTDALSNGSSVTYNIVGQVLKAYAPATGNTGAGTSYTLNTYQYPGGLPSAVSAYDENGTLVRQVNYAYGSEAELLSVTGNTEPKSYTYDSAFRVKTIADGNGQTTTYNYDYVGNLASVVYPGTDTVTFPSYDAAGNLLQRIDGNGLVTNYSYSDVEDQLTSVTYPSSAANNSSLAYDSYGRLQTVTDGSGAHGYTYGDLDEVLTNTTTYTGVPAQTLSYGYYPDGSRSNLSSPGGNFTYNYDSAGRLTSMVSPAGTSSNTYLDNDWPASRTLANGAKSTYGFNAVGGLTSLVNQTSANAIISQYTGFTYDGVFNRTGMTASVPGTVSQSGTTTWNYDTKDRLLQEQTTRAGGYTSTFGYDAAGNPTTFKGSSRVYNSNNQRSATGFSYDLNGNPTTYNGTGLTFDPENRLTTVGSVLSAGYRSDGLRAWRQGSVRSYTVYDGDTPLYELSSSGSPTVLNIFGADGLQARQLTGSTTHYLFDPQGSVAQRLDGTQSILNSSLFDAYGAESATTTPTDPFGFNAQSGYLLDRDTGLYLCEHRYYDVATGRWVTRDPIGYSGGMNLYGYAGSGPIDNTDPVGERPINGGDQRRFRLIRQYGSNLDRKLVDGALSQLSARIASGPARDPANLRALWWAIDHLGETRFGKAGNLAGLIGIADVPGNEWKCNAFVALSYADGAELGFGPYGVPRHSTWFPWGTRFHRYTANQLADPSVSVGRFRVSSGADAGDIIAFTEPGGRGHSTLKLGKGLLIYAGTDASKIGTFRQVMAGHSRFTIRKWTP